MKTALVLNGPNLNLLGTREPEKYGHATIADVEKLVRAMADGFGWAVEFRQSNHEGVLVDWIQEAAAKGAVGIVLNPAAYTTTSIALLDALSAAALPIIEVHLSNIFRRESFRHHSYVSLAANGVICGLQALGYELALDGIASLIEGESDEGAL